MSTTAVNVTDLIKTYPDPEGGEFNAVDGLSFEVQPGEVFGILGPNGAGKTTTLEIIEGLKQATSGRAEVGGIDVAHDPKAVKERIGVQLQASSYFEQLTLTEILELFGSFYSRSRRPGELLERVGLSEKRNAQVRHLSGGQAQRFSIVAALVNDPDVVFLDEPTTGLDPQARRNAWDLIQSINEEGKTVILTTHYMEEAEVLSDRIAIVDHGQLRALDTPAGLIGRLDAGHQISFSLPGAVDESALRSIPGVVQLRSRLNGSANYELVVDRPAESVPALYAWAGAASARLEDVQIRSATLEDVFLDVTGRALRN